MNTASDIKISVCVNTYNQVKYIDQTLQSILRQKTDFLFDVIVHDDCSTDGTASLLKNYEKQYPDNIKCIFQSCNQFSINPHLPFINCWSQARGQFIALCEGDDYWIDEYKLQKQFDHISSTDTDICFTNAIKVDAKGKVAPFYDKEYGSTGVVSLLDVLKRGGGAMPTASILVKRSILQDLPDWFLSAPVGDYFVQLLGAARKGASYLCEATTAYRVEAEASWSQSRARFTEDYIWDMAEKYVSTFKALDLKNIDLKYINYALSKELFQLAVVSYKNDFRNLAKVLIDRSWMYYKFINAKQFILYMILKF